MVLASPYRGFMAPVFTPFGPNGQLYLNEIPNYAKYLVRNNVKAILVNGTVGEGALMSVEERKQVIDSWVAAATDLDLFIMVHVGAANVNAVVELAKHAESIGVGAILCLPDPFFRPVSVSDVVDYLKIVSDAAPKTPLFYYNYPDLTGIKLDMVEFLTAAFKEIPTLSGLKYTHNNLDEGIRCVQLFDRAFTIFLGNDQLISAALCLGFDSMIVTSLNFAHKEIFEIKNQIEKGDNEGARINQRRITDLVYFTLENTPFISRYKAIILMVCKLKLGEPRQPIKKISSTKLELLIKELKNKKWI